MRHYYAHNATHVMNSFPFVGSNAPPMQGGSILIIFFGMWFWHRTDCTHKEGCCFVQVQHPICFTRYNSSWKRTLRSMSKCCWLIGTRAAAAAAAGCLSVHQSRRRDAVVEKIHKTVMESDNHVLMLHLAVPNECQLSVMGLCRFK